MGQGVCCVQQKLEFGIAWISPEDESLAPDCSGPHAVNNCPTSRPPRFRGRGRSNSTAEEELSAVGHPQDEEDFVTEVAVDLATTCQSQQTYESAALIPVRYDVQEPVPEAPKHILKAVDRKTGFVRQLATYKKPTGDAAKERLRAYVLALQRVGKSSDAVARVVDVFEDYVHVHLLLEYCTGGTAYDRILERQYFTEQESAVIVRHMLEALEVLHQEQLYHGCLAPDSFRFQHDMPHAPLKLVDFGIELKVHRWDAVEQINGGPDLQNPVVPQFYETCKLVFVAPEIAPPHQAQRRRQKQGGAALLCEAPQAVGLVGRPSSALRGNSDQRSILDGEVLADVLDEHAEWFEAQQQELTCDYHRKFEGGVADMWSAGAIAYLLLCGYPPFFAPSRNAILGRIHRGEVAFDPPFWSRISEEAKSFVSCCLSRNCWSRFTVQQALSHPWIRGLAESSPSGSMFTSFTLNLRRFYRTSLVETAVANMLAPRLQRADMREFLKQCKDIDLYSAGFFTATDLRQVLTAMGFSDISEAVTSRFIRTFRHPGESYIDYAALLDSVFLRRRRMFEDLLWQHFQRVCQQRGGGTGENNGGEAEGWLAVSELGAVLDDPLVTDMLASEIAPALLPDQDTLRRWLLKNIQEYCAACGMSQLEFHDLAVLLLRFVRVYETAQQQAAPAGQQARQGPAPLCDVCECGDEATQDTWSPTGVALKQASSMDDDVEDGSELDRAPTLEASGSLEPAAACAARSHEEEGRDSQAARQPNSRTASPSDAMTMACSQQPGVRPPVLADPEAEHAEQAFALGAAAKPGRPAPTTPSPSGRS
eukprot:TRINITY_DN111288_c0_g1_i1.p1 TRINITY_DN111288_c0_g1~~TRINITY_DN111288_c0_g1_i1.p1  ORF type:complete len:838 (-),score=150.09 TRINITY_DN111288_c0_g1_i1:175-2634(-)